MIEPFVDDLRVDAGGEQKRGRVCRRTWKWISGSFARFKSGFRQLGTGETCRESANLSE